MRGMRKRKRDDQAPCHNDPALHPTAYADWYRIEPVRKLTGTDTLADVDSHVRRRFWDAVVHGAEGKEY